ncbi:hypothetical protein H4R35_004133 [Dimargaris xerosporica]|nr:hypothetical protein H4R35_004133 [Dimargaris xerosporica]
MGLSEKTKESEEFVALREVTESKKSAVDGLENAVRMFIEQSEKRKGSSDSSKIKVTPVENLGNTMMGVGRAFSERSLLGQTMLKVGESQEQISRALEDFIMEIKDPFSRNINEFRRQLDEFALLKKKLKSRRLEYDAKAAKTRGSKKDRPDFDEEARLAQQKYEDTYDQMLSLMLQLEDDEDMYLEDLTAFYHAEIAYHRKAVTALEEIAEWMQSATSLKRKSARERFNIDVPQRDHDREATDASNGLSRQPSRADYPPGSTVGRKNSMTSMAPSSHYGADDEKTEMYNYAHGIDPIDHDDDLRLAGTRGSSSSRSTRASAQLPSAPTARQRSTTAYQPNAVYRKAVYDFDASADDELSFREGDIILVAQELDDEGWWEGEVHDPRTGRVSKGMFPVNYTEEHIVEPSPPPSESDEPRPRLPSRTNSVRSEAQMPPPPPYYEEPEPTPPPPPAVPAATKPLVSATNHRAPPPPPTSAPSIVASRLGRPPVVPASQIQTKTVSAAASMMAARASAAPSTATASVCSTCGCDEYTANVFRKNICSNCFHHH